jgi:hypothetical protein
VFNGLDPSGTGKLYVVDDTFGDVGSIGGGWSLNLTIAPPTLGRPSITGSPEVGKTLTASSGPIGNGDAASYRWSRCTLAGAACAAIAGANQSTYVPTVADKGHTLIVTETATNSGGSASATSTPTSGVGPPIVSAAGTRKTQRVLKRRGIVAFATSDIAGGLLARATVRIANASRTYRFKSVRKTLAPGVRTKARLKLSSRGLRAVRNALDGGRKLKAQLRLTVTDSNGGRTTKKLTIRLRK